MKLTEQLKSLHNWALKYDCKAYIENDRVVINGNFSCSGNQLTSLPDSIGNMTVGGNFYCSENQLTSLPDSIGNMTVGGNFSCSYN